MTEKYSRATGEKILDLMRVMCGFKTDYKIETLMDNFEEMVTEIRRVDLAKNL